MYGITLGHFATESETMPYPWVDAVLVKSMVLDYFLSVERAAKLAEEMYVDGGGSSSSSPSFRLFAFTDNGELGQGDRQFLSHLCLTLGFPSSPPELLTNYLTGENRTIVDHFPEFRVLRDVCFMLGVLLRGEEGEGGGVIPEERGWGVMDASLRWGYERGVGVTVKGFGKELTSFGVVRGVAYHLRFLGGAVSDAVRGLGEGMVTDRGALVERSLADPNNLVGGEKGEWFKTKGGRGGKGGIEREEDVLYLRKLPSLGEGEQQQQQESTLTPKEKEILLQILTTPYLRIPLLLDFFAHENRIAALSSPPLQKVITAALFESGKYLPTTHRPPPPHIPSQDPPPSPTPSSSYFATPNGLLINELQLSPDGIIRPLLAMLNLSTGLDGGAFSGKAAGIFFFVVRLCVYVEGYLAALLVHHDRYGEEGGEGVSLAGGLGWVRGLLVGGGEVGREGGVVSRMRAQLGMLRQLMFGR